MQKNSLIGAHLPPGQADAIAGVSAVALTATGTSQTDAYQIGADVSQFDTVAASTGAKLIPGCAPGDELWLFNNGAQTLTVYPPTGEQINDGTVTTGGFSVAANKGAVFKKSSSLNWIGIVTA